MGQIGWVVQMIHKAGVAETQSTWDIRLRRHGLSWIQ